MLYIFIKLHKSAEWRHRAHLKADNHKGKLILEQSLSLSSCDLSLWHTLSSAPISGAL